VSSSCEDGEKDSERVPPARSPFKRKFMVKKKNKDKRERERGRPVAMDFLSVKLYLFYDKKYCKIKKVVWKKSSCSSTWNSTRNITAEVEKICHYLQKDLYLLYLDGCGVTD
jgi:hypothetical protein